MRARREAAAVPAVALAGYTNAGKSTLLNALTGAGVGVGERLFHTLDPTTRAYEHDGRRYLITDTVGFIRKLPHQLVEAFKATLEETRLADLLVHVVDGSDPAPIRAPRRSPPSTRCSTRSAPASSRGCWSSTSSTCSTPRRAASCWSAVPDAIGVSAETGEGIDELRDRIEAAFVETLREVELLVPYAEGARLSELYELAGDLERTERADGVLVRARIPAAARAPVRRVRGQRQRAASDPEPSRGPGSRLMELGCIEASRGRPPADPRQ